MQPSDRFIRFKTSWTITPPTTDITLPPPPSVKPIFAHSTVNRQSFPRAASMIPDENSKGNEIQNSRNEKDGNATYDRANSPPALVPENQSRAGPSSAHVIPGSVIMRENSDPERDSLAAQQIPLSAVSERRRRTVRETDIPIFFFSSVGSDPLLEPPSMPVSFGLEVDDIYVHKSQRGSQAWRCSTVSPQVTWMKLKEKEKYTFNVGDERYFVITPTGLPSWVTRDTLGRTYKDKNDGSTNPPPSSSSKTRAKASEQKGKGMAKSL